MALNIATFRTRTLTAIVFAVVMLGGVLWNYWSFFALFSVIHFGCWQEYQKLVARIDKGYASISRFHKYAVMIMGWCFLLYFTGHHGFRIYSVWLSEIALWLGMLLFVLLLISELLFTKPAQPKNIAHSILGLVYISLPFGLMIDLRNQGFGNILGRDIDLGWIVPLVLIASIWINDTMAYVVGSLIGKTPFSKISPKKTWEGTAGGAILAILVVAFIMKWIFPETELLIWGTIAAIAAIFGTIGDLFESKLKRLADVKDSGHIMPGHGGFLDRFDSMLFAIPFVWLYVVVLSLV